MTPDEIAAAKARAYQATHPCGVLADDVRALIAALAAAQGQVAALREMPDGYGCDDCLAARHDDHDDTMCDGCSAAARKILADTVAAALEHNAAMRAAAFEEAIARLTERQRANAVMLQATRADEDGGCIAALREKARKP